MSDIQKKKKVKAVMKHYHRIIRQEGYEWAKWTKYRRRLSITKANTFFINIMLDQRGTTTDRASDSAKHLVDNYFNQTDNFWNEIIDTSDDNLHRICVCGFDGQPYAGHWNINKFPIWLKNNARKMIDEYNSDPRNIWNNAEVDEIRERFEQFSGIAEALSRMATNQLVRRYGVAGGDLVKKQLFLKPDIYLKRVMYRIGFIENENRGAVLKEEKTVKQCGILPSPADFDAATWVIGNEYCHKQNPKCKDCPVNHVCDWYANAG